MNPGKLLSPRHSPSCGPLKQQQLGDQDERHPGPRRASEQKRAMAARIAASSFSSAPSSPRLERRGAPVAGAPVVHLRGGQEPNVGRGAVYTGIFVGTLATYAPIPAVFFSFSLLLSTSGRALVMLGPGAAHGCPPLSGACHRGAHQQKKTGGDPKSHVGAPGHYCSRGARRGVFFLLLPDAGALMGRRALGVASRGGAHPKWPL